MKDAGVSVVWSSVKEIANIKSTEWNTWTQSPFVKLTLELWEWPIGRSFTIDTPKDLAEVTTKVGVELRNQYLLGYRPDVANSDGKWHKIKVKLLPPKGLPQLEVHARQGYYNHEQSRGDAPDIAEEFLR